MPRPGVLSRVLLLAATLLAAGADVAESRQGATLESVEAAMAAGRLTEARQLLERWNRENPVGGRASGADRARALLNAGRLSSDLAGAEEAFLGVVLAHPSSPAAPEALLRLGQVLLATGDAARATGYLERLTADYPTAQQRAPGLLWLGRAHGAAGRRDAACATFARAVEVARDAETRGLAEADRAACNAAPVAAAAPALPAAAPGARPGGPPASAARFALQAGAFRERSGAESHAARLRQAGYQPRVVTVEGSALWRVRMGAFTSSDEASREARALAARGFEAIVVSDARNERR